jgi:hypothetical protein
MAVFEAWSSLSPDSPLLKVKLPPLVPSSEATTSSKEFNRGSWRSLYRSEAGASEVGRRYQQICRPVIAIAI